MQNYTKNAIALWFNIIYLNQDLFHEILTDFKELCMFDGNELKVTWK